MMEILQQGECHDIMSRLTCVIRVSPWEVEPEDYEKIPEFQNYQRVSDQVREAENSERISDVDSERILRNLKFLFRYFVIEISMKFQQRNFQIIQTSSSH